MEVRLEIATKILAAYMSKSLVPIDLQAVRSCLDIANVLVDMHSSDEKKRREGIPPPPPPPPGKEFP
jgi:hypothetical protein